MSWQEDAALAGTVHKRSKPFTAMLIARCVEPQQGARTDLLTTEKVPAKTFADHAGIAVNTVLKYLRTWDAMAAAGLVPSREEMAAGEDVEVPEQKAWVHYYREANPSKPRTPKPSPEGIDKLSEVELTERVVKMATRLGAIEETVKGDTPGQLAFRRAAENARLILAGGDVKKSWFHLIDALTELGAYAKEI